MDISEIDLDMLGLENQVVDATCCDLWIILKKKAKFPAAFTYNSFFINRTTKSIIILYRTGIENSKNPFDSEGTISIPFDTMKDSKSIQKFINKFAIRNKKENVHKEI